MSQPPDVFSDVELERALSSLPQWQVVDGKLRREFVFRNFVEAFGFMTQVALVAERADHHPEWSNVYKTVRVALVTHESGGITARDVVLARAMNALA